MVFRRTQVNRVAGAYDPNKGLDEKSTEAQSYLKKHDEALKYAMQSRKIIAKRVLKVKLLFSYSLELL